MTKARKKSNFADPISLCVVALLFMSVAPLHAQSGPSPADLQFTFAVRLMRQKQTELASEAFERFVREDADDPRVGDAHYYLAMLKRERGDRTGALKELKLVSKPVYVTAGALAVLRGQLLLENGDAAGALAVLEPLNATQFSEAQTAPTPAPGTIPRTAPAPGTAPGTVPGTVAVWHYLLGAAYQGVGNTGAAAKQFAKAVAVAKNNSAVRGLALLEWAKTQIERKELEKGLETLKQVVGKPPESPDSKRMMPGVMPGVPGVPGVTREIPGVTPGVRAGALKLAGAVAEQLGKWRQAAGYYREIVQRYQSTTEFGAAAVGWLRVLFNSGDDAQVAGRAKGLSKLVDESVRVGVDYWWAAALIRQKKYAEAQKVCGVYLEDRETGSGDLRYLDAVAEFHLNAGKFRQWYDRTDVKGFSAAQRDHLLYLRAEAEQDVSRAIGMLGVVIDRSDSVYARPALLLRAKLYEQAGQEDQAAADYQRFSKRYARDGQAERAMAYAVDLALAGGEYERVVAMVGGIARPGAAMALKLAVAWIKLGKNENAGKVLEEVLAAKPGPGGRTKALAMYYKGLLLVRPEVKEGQDIGLAVAMLRRAMAGDLPEEQRLKALAVTGRLQRMAGQTDAALKTYQRLRSVDPTGRFDGATALWVGRGLLDGGDAKAAKTWFEAAGEGVKKKDALWAAAMFGRAEAERRLGQWEKAIEHYRMLLGYSSSYGERGRLGLAQSLAASGRRDQAMEEYNGLLDARASEVAATALTESALLKVAAADRRERGGDAAGAKADRKEARRRLSRVVILYNLPELEGLPIRAMVLLGRLEEAEGLTARAKAHYAQAAKEGGEGIARPQADLGSEAAWRMVGRGELKRMEGQVGDAVFLFGKVAKDQGAGEAGIYAKQRLAALGDKS